ncbi:MAG TPA: dihydrofolate reductase [Spirochaetia bacterium]|nr:dihydrofolate reductase [Spirochaetia bacterium]
MPVSLIAAVAANRVIGNAGRLPWRLRDDLARFRRLTMGHQVVMGRKTWESLGKPLEGRRSIVLTRSAGVRFPGAETAGSREEALRMSEGEDLFVIGGAAVYELFLPVASRLLITHVDADVPGDTLFPPVRWEEWRAVAEEPAGIQGPGIPPHRFVDYERK